MTDDEYKNYISFAITYFSKKLDTLDSQQKEIIDLLRNCKVITKEVIKYVEKDDWEFSVGRPFRGDW